MITLTASAAARVRDWIQTEKAQGKAFRIYVEPGSVTGHEIVYTLDRCHDDDRTFPGDGFQVIVDPWSFTYLRGATIDANAAGFQIRIPDSPWGPRTGAAS